LYFKFLLFYLISLIKKFLSHLYLHLVLNIHRTIKNDEKFSYTESINQIKDNIDNESSVFKNKILKLKITIEEKETRKYKRDCIHKKIKTNHFRFLKNFIEETFFIKLNIFKKKLISTVSINFNRKLYSMNLKDFLNKIDHLFKNINDKEKVLSNEEWKDSILELTLFDFFEKFYYDENSEFHKEQNNFIYIYEGEKYYERYNYYDKRYLNYFKDEKANKQRSDVNKLKPRK